MYQNFTNIGRIKYGKTINITLDYRNACRTNTSSAIKGEHYDIKKLLSISGADFDILVKDIQFCAENRDDEEVIMVINRFADVVLSAYEIQSDSYKKKD